MMLSTSVATRFFETSPMTIRPAGLSLASFSSNFRRHNRRDTECGGQGNQCSGAHRSIMRIPNENTELYQVTKKFLAKVHELGLYDKFSALRGADLLYACIARVENIPLVTHDSDFDPYSKELTLIKPCDLMRHTGKVTIQKGSKRYTVGYEEVRDSSGGTVRLDTGQATHVGGLTAKVVAQHLLQAVISSGHANKLGLGRPQQK
jgi:hypothetical protein